MELSIALLSEEVVGIKTPSYEGDAGLDLVVCYPVVILPGAMANIPHGFAVEVPEGHFGLIMPRSSTIRNTGGNLLVMASPIDSGYRGEIYTMVRNIGTTEVRVEKGDRVSQLVILPFKEVSSINRVERLSLSERSWKGFGSTGK